MKPVSEVWLEVVKESLGRGESEEIAIRKGNTVAAQYGRLFMEEGVLEQVSVPEEASDIDYNKSALIE